MFIGSKLESNASATGESIRGNDVANHLRRTMPTVYLASIFSGAPSLGEYQDAGLTDRLA